MRVAYADPPYIGQAKKHYGPEAREVDHVALVSQLECFDAWALSLSSPSLLAVLSLCPPSSRVGVWVKPFASFKPGVNPAYAWEPVIFSPGRKRGREMPTVRDWVSCNITLKRGLAGVKPDAFCFWLFDLLACHPDDEFHDLFPGSGAVGVAWKNYQEQARAADA